MSVSGLCWIINKITLNVIIVEQDLLTKNYFLTFYLVGLFEDLSRE